MPDTGGPVTVTALKNGQVDAADLFTTDPAIKANNFVILARPEEQLRRAERPAAHQQGEGRPTASRRCSTPISAKLTTEASSTCATKVENDKQDPDAVGQGVADDQRPRRPPATGAKGVTLTVGSANFPENVVLADIYAEALKAQGATVSTKLNIGSREKYSPALKDGSIDLIPEYSGTLLTYLDKTATATTPDDVYAALAKALPANLIALDQSAAQDSDAIVVTKATAEKYNLTSIADLAKAAS